MAFFVAASCSDSTGPTPAACTVPAEAMPEAQLLSSVIVAEAQRVVANLPQQGSIRDNLSRSMTAMSTPLNAGSCSTTQIAAARAAVDAYQAVVSTPAVQADLDALRLMVDAAQRFLDGLR
jgi:hypothetical protein